MKHIFSFFIAATLLVACNNAPKGYVIKGTVSADFPGDSAILLDEASNAEIMVVPIVDGKFEMRGSVTTPYSAFVSPNADGIMARIVLENAEYKFFGSAARSYVEGGGPVHKDVGAFENSKEYFDAVMTYEKADKAMSEDPTKDYNNLSPEDNSMLRDLQDVIIGMQDNAYDNVIENPKALPMSRIIAIGRSSDWDRYSDEKRIALLKQINKEQGGNYQPAIDLCKKLEQEVEALKEKERQKAALAEGNPYRDIEVVDTEGNRVKLSDVIAKNKYTILEFWASWCNPCRAEIPNLKEAYAKYKSKGLEIFAVSLDEKKDAWTQALGQEKTPWLNFWDEKAFNGTSALSYAIEAVPASFLISQDGKLVVTEEGALRGPNLEETLSEFLK